MQKDEFIDFIKNNNSIDNSIKLNIIQSIEHIILKEKEDLLLNINDKLSTFELIPNKIIYRLSLNSGNNHKFVYYPEGSKINMSYGETSIENVYVGDLLQDGTKINQIADSTQIDIKKEVLSNYILNNNSIEVNSIFKEFKNNLHKEFVIPKIASTMCRILERDSSTALYKYLKNSDNYNNFKYALTNHILHTNIHWYEGMKNIDIEKFHYDLNLNKLTEDESNDLIVAVKVINNLFNSYAKFYDLKNIENKSQIDYVFSQTKIIFKDSEVERDYSAKKFEKDWETINDLNQSVLDLMSDIINK